MVYPQGDTDPLADRRNVNQFGDERWDTDTPSTFASDVRLSTTTRHTHRDRDGRQISSSMSSSGKMTTGVMRGERLQRPLKPFPNPFPSPSKGLGGQHQNLQTSSAAWHIGSDIYSASFHDNDGDDGELLAKISLSEWIKMYAAERERYRSALLAMEMRLDQTQRITEHMAVPNTIRAVTTCALLDDLVLQLPRYASVLARVAEDVRRCIFVSRSAIEREGDDVPVVACASDDDIFGGGESDGDVDGLVPFFAIYQTVAKEIRKQKAEVLLSRQQSDLLRQRAHNVKAGWLKCIMARRVDELSNAFLRWQAFVEKKRKARCEARAMEKLHKRRLVHSCWSHWRVASCESERANLESQLRSAEVEREVALDKAAAADAELTRLRALTAAQEQQLNQQEKALVTAKAELDDAMARILIADGRGSKQS